MEDVLVIPRHLVTIRFIDIPSLDETEIKDMLKLQAIKEVPYQKEDIVLSFKNLGSFKEGVSSIMLVIAKKDMILQKIHSIEEKGLKVEDVRLHTELLYVDLLKKGTINSEKVSLVIYIGKVDSEIMVIDKTRLILSRGFKNSDRFFNELNTTILGYKREKANPEIEDIIIVHPADVDIEDVKPSLKDFFTIPVTFHKCKHECRIDFSKEDNISLKIDLFPQELIRKNRELQQKHASFLTYSLIGIILMLYVGFFYFKSYQKAELLKVFSSKLEKMQSEIDSIEKFNKKRLVLEKHEKEGEFIIKVLKETHDLVPSGMVIAGLNYDGKENIFYKGSSRDSSAVFNFVKTLEGLKYFEKVEIKYTAKRKIKNGELTDFNIQCKIGRSL